MKLNQVVSIFDKQLKPRVQKEFAEIHHRSSKPDLFGGFTRTYERLKDDDETYPHEVKRVQFSAKDSIAKARALLSDLFNLSSERDLGNTIAKADVVVDGTTILKNVPAVTLLFIEKQLKHEVKPFIDALPTLSPDFEWVYDDATGLYKTPTPVRTSKTKKVHNLIVKAPATDKHPAQTELLYDDRTVGYWNKIEFSGGIPAPQKDDILLRIDKLLRAVKVAIQDANSVNAPKSEDGIAVFGYIFDGLKT